MLCANLDGWSGFGGGRHIIEAGDICICTADSLPCTAETQIVNKCNPIKKEKAISVSFLQRHLERECSLFIIKG